jgi:hypothetical protein
MRFEFDIIQNIFLLTTFEDRLLQPLPKAFQNKTINQFRPKAHSAVSLKQNTA